MVKIQFDLTETENKIINIIKAKQNFNNKVQAIKYLIEQQKKVIK